MTKTVINHKFRLEKYFQEILYMVDVWVNDWSGWNVKSIESQYINISTHRQLSGSSYMDLPVELRSPTKGLINIKNKDKKCFSCMLDILLLQKNIQKELKKTDKKNCWETWLWWNWVSCARQRVQQNWSKKQYMH